VSHYVCSNKEVVSLAHHRQVHIIEVLLIYMLIILTMETVTAEARAVEIK